MLKVGTARFQKIQNKSAIGKQMLRIMASSRLHDSDLCLPGQENVTGSKG